QTSPRIRPRTGPLLWRAPVRRRRRDHDGRRRRTSDRRNPAYVGGVSERGGNCADVDGGHPIAVIPRMLEEFQKGAAIVQCRRTAFAGRPETRRLGSAAFRYLCWLV